MKAEVTATENSRYAIFMCCDQKFKVSDWIYIPTQMNFQSIFLQYCFYISVDLHVNKQYAALAIKFVFHILFFATISLFVNLRNI